MTLLELIQSTTPDQEPTHLGLDFQIGTIRETTTKGGKPYFDLEIIDATAKEKIKVWSDTPSFSFCETLKGGECVHGTARFSRNQYGLNVEELQMRHLTPEEIEEFLAGSPERQAQLSQDFAFLKGTVEAFRDPRLRALGLAFLNQMGDRFCRAGAAREIHHARRGGLLEHTAQMLRTAEALRPVYPNLNWDLIGSGVLFHDVGKLWEHDYPAQSFVPTHQVLGELLGHISIGIEVVNKFWRELATTPEFQESGTPAAETVRQHLLHLIASHHGQKDYGAPVTPRTPEAWVLHYIDNLDARVEMMRGIYSEKSQIAPGIYDRKRPLEGNAVEPLAPWEATG